MVKWSVRRTMTHGGNAPNAHLDRLDLEVKGNQGKDNALRGDA